jgi:hypothetical protein
MIELSTEYGCCGGPVPVPTSIRNRVLLARLVRIIEALQMDLLKHAACRPRMLSVQV